jgi:hypothetical protein
MIDGFEYQFGTIEAEVDFENLLGEEPVTEQKLKEVVQQIYIYLDWIMKGSNDWVISRKLGYINQMRKLMVRKTVEVIQ